MTTPDLPHDDNEPHPCEACWTAIRTRADQLIARPGVVAVLARMATLTPDEQQRMTDLWLDNFQTYRVTQLGIRHRVGRALGQDMLDTVLGVRSHIWRLADRRGFSHWAVNEAIEDAVYADMVAEHLTTDERRLFDQPWTDAVNPTKGR